MFFGCLNLADPSFTEILGSEHDAGALSTRRQGFVTVWSRSKRVRKTRAFVRKIKLEGAMAVGQGGEYGEGEVSCVTEL